MLFHRLKPHQGWSTFVWEVVIVVLGVGIALVAQQWVEERGWRAKVRNAERQIQRETSDNFFYAAERVAVAPCVNAQLDKVIAAAMAPGDRLAPFPAIHSGLGDDPVRQPQRPFNTTAWKGIVGDGIAAHFDEDRRSILSTAYNQIEDIQSLTALSSTLNANLGLALYPVPLDPQVRARLIELATALKSNNANLALKGLQALSAIDVVGMAPPREPVERRFANRWSGTFEYCRAHGLPLEDWRQAFAKQHQDDMRDDDDLGRYMRAHPRS